MAGFNDLPNELIQEILNHIQPEDIENFVMMSKHVYCLSDEVVQQHTEMKARYSTYGCDENKGVSPARLLNGILLNPQIAYYVKDLELSTWFFENPFGDDYLPTDGFYLSDRAFTEHITERFQHAARKSAPPGEAAEWIQCVEDGDRDSIVALLLPLLTNVQTITINTSRASAVKTVSTLGRLVDTSTINGLCGLKNVTINGNDKSGDWKIVKSLMCLPSMRSIKATWLDKYGKGCTSSATSNVEELTLENCAITRKSLLNFLRAFTSLRKVRFESETTKRLLKPDSIRRALLTHARWTLQDLTIFFTDNKQSPPAMGSLRGFKMLKQVETSIKLLYDYDNVYLREMLAHVLPRSIETLVLWEDRSIDHASLEGLVSQVQKHKVLHMPLLRLLEVRLHGYFFDIDISGRDKKYALQLIKQCNEVGVELRFWP